MEVTRLVSHKLILEHWFCSNQLHETKNTAKRKWNTNHMTSCVTTRVPRSERAPFYQRGGFLQPTRSFPLIHSVLLHCGRSRTSLHPSTRRQPRAAQTQAERWHPAVTVRQRACVYVHAHAQWCEEAQTLPVTCTCTTWKNRHKGCQSVTQSMSTWGTRQPPTAQQSHSLQVTDED